MTKDHPDQNILSGWCCTQPPRDSPRTWEPSLTPSPPFRSLLPNVPTATYRLSNHQKFLRSQYFSDKGNLSLLLRLQTQNNVNHCEGIIFSKGPKSSVQQICSLVLKTTEIHVNLKRYISRGFLAHFFDTFDMKVS